jgi:hypothetical protein
MFFIPSNPRPRGAYVVCAENMRELALAGRAAAVPMANQVDF